MIPRKRRKTKRKRNQKRSLTDTSKMFKEEAIEAMDDLVLHSLDKDDYDDFEEYEEEMQDFTFSSIFQ